MALAILYCWSLSAISVAKSPDAVVAEGLYIFSASFCSQLWPVRFLLALWLSLVKPDGCLARPDGHRRSPAPSIL